MKEKAKKAVKKTVIVNMRGFDAELHKRMKVEAVLEEITMRELVEKAVTKYLSQKKGG